MNEQSTLTSLDNAAGIDLSDVKSLDKLLKIANLDFDISEDTIHTPEGHEIEGKTLLRRSDNNHILGVVGSKYTPVSNRVMLTPFHELVTQYDAKYESAGVLRGGKKCWISATMPGDFTVPGRRGDVINQRIVCLISNDGMGRNAYFTLANRLMCNNQLRLIMDSASKSDYSLHHTKNWEAQFNAAAAGFSEAIAAHSRFEEVVQDLSQIKMTTDEVEVFARHLYDVHDREIQTPQALKREEKLKVLFVRGQGNLGQTRWDALNAVTELLDHHRPGKFKTKDAARRAVQNRFVSNNLSGYGDRIKQRAVSLLLDTKQFN
jgi:phage/plasmid-like protein (TIGR03299 family)